jgi:hypothetical protein
MKLLPEIYWEISNDHLLALKKDYSVELSS